MKFNTNFKVYLSNVMNAVQSYKDQKCDTG